MPRSCVASRECLSRLIRYDPGPRSRTWLQGYIFQEISLLPFALPWSKEFSHVHGFADAQHGDAFNLSVPSRCRVGALLFYNLAIFLHFLPLRSLFSVWSWSWEPHGHVQNLALTPGGVGSHPLCCFSAMVKKEENDKNRTAQQHRVENTGARKEGA